MKLNTYIFFDGCCEEAMTAYAHILGGRIGRMVRMRDMPGAPMPPGWDDKIMHMRLDLEGGSLMASDAPPEHRQKASGFYVQLDVATLADAERIYASLKDGGEVRMPLQQTEWAQAFAMIVDRFGTPWMINSEKSS